MVESSGAAIARDPVRFCGVSTPLERRRGLGVRGFVPAAYIPLDLNVERCMTQLRAKHSALEQYIYLQSIQDVNERLYFAMLVKYTAELMPIVCKYNHPIVHNVCSNIGQPPPSKNIDSLVIYSQRTYNIQ